MLLMFSHSVLRVGGGWLGVKPVNHQFDQF